MGCELTALVPASWFNLVRYEGIFSPGHAWRSSVVPGPQGSKRRCCDAHDPSPQSASASNGRAEAERNIPWADLMRRTLGIDPEICDCGAKMMVVDVITEVETISEVMVSMGLTPTKVRAP